MGNMTDAGKRLATEAIRADRSKIFKFFDLGSRVPLTQ